MKSDSKRWYETDGYESGVFVFSKARLSRNLANFPFSDRLIPQDKERILSIVLDCFNHFPDADNYSSIFFDKLKEGGILIMKEREIIQNAEYEKGAVIYNDLENISCVVNTEDHIRFSKIESGLALQKVFDSVYDIDAKFQELVQFAASYDFGYLNSFFTDCGSGMQLSCRMFLPACGILEKTSYINDYCHSHNILFKASYAPASTELISGFVSPGISLGSYYDLITMSATDGSELDQLAEMVSVVKKVMETEMQLRKECEKNHLLELKNYFNRSLSLARSSLFIPFKEGVEIIGGMRFAKNLGLLTGIDNADLNSLICRIQPGHLDFLYKSGNVKFEKGFEPPQSKAIDRLRALILQEAFADIKLAL